MEFFRKNEQVEFHQGDVVHFKNSVDTSYHYAIIVKLPSNLVSRYDDDERGIANSVEKYTTIILNDENPFYAGESYQMAGSIDKLIDGLKMSWDIVEKARTRTEDLTD